MATYIWADYQPAQQTNFMNINLKVAFFAILLIKLSTQISYSQVTTSKGYLVLNNNDTIRGYLENLDDEFLDKVLFVCNCKSYSE